MPMRTASLRLAQRKQTFAVMFVSARVEMVVSANVVVKPVSSSLGSSTSCLLVVRAHARHFLTLSIRCCPSAANLSVQTKDCRSQNAVLVLHP